MSYGSVTAKDILGSAYSRIFGKILAENWMLTRQVAGALAVKLDGLLKIIGLFTAMSRSPLMRRQDICRRSFLPARNYSVRGHSVQELEGSWGNRCPQRPSAERQRAGARARAAWYETCSFQYRDTQILLRSDK